MTMKNPPHPGLSIRYDCLEPLGLNVTKAAAHLGVSRKHLSYVINGRSGIPPKWLYGLIRRLVVALILGTDFRRPMIWRK